MTEHRISLSADIQAAMDRVVASGHSVFSPSGSKMWRTCAGSLLANLMVHDDAGPEAAEGTVAHGVGELWLKTRQKPKHLIGTQEIVHGHDWSWVINIDQEMLGYVQEYVDWCRLLPGDHFVETKVFFSQLTPIPNQGGTADHVACEPGRMVITDLKYGQGVPVYAENNSQALLYALGFFYAYDWWYDFQEFEIRICQPRLNIFDTWTVNREYLLAFAEQVRKDAAAAWRHDAPRKASVDGCRWCRVKKTCAEHARFLLEMTYGAFDDLYEMKEVLQHRRFEDKRDVRTLTTAELSALYEHRAIVNGFWDDLKAELMKRAKNGEKLPFQKQVAGRMSRNFRNPKVAAKQLIAMGCAEKDVQWVEYVSPAESEKLLRKLGIKGEDLRFVMESELDIQKKPGAPTLASLTDKREVLRDLSEDAFADIIENRE